MRNVQLQKEGWLANIGTLTSAVPTSQLRACQALTRIHLVLQVFNKNSTAVAHADVLQNLFTTISRNFASVFPSHCSDRQHICLRYICATGI
jgi:hypothetical protein